MLKVENVVKPPQNPIVNAARTVTSFTGDHSPLSQPMRKLPTMLMSSVAKGKRTVTGAIHVEIPKRASVPAAPPAAMARAKSMDATYRATRALGSGSAGSGPRR